MIMTKDYERWYRMTHSVPLCCEVCGEMLVYGGPNIYRREYRGGHVKCYKSWEGE